MTKTNYIKSLKQEIIKHEARISDAKRIAAQEIALIESHLKRGIGYQGRIIKDLNELINNHTGDTDIKKENTDVKVSGEISGTDLTVYFLTCGTAEIKKGKRLIWSGTNEIFRRLNRSGFQVA